MRSYTIPQWRELAETTGQSLEQIMSVLEKADELDNQLSLARRANDNDRMAIDRWLAAQHAAGVDYSQLSGDDICHKAGAEAKQGSRSYATRTMRRLLQKHYPQAAE